MALGCFFVFSATVFALDLRTLVTDVTDRRSTNETNGSLGLELKLRLIGDDTAGIAATRPVVSVAVDDTGRDLTDISQKPDDFCAVRRSGTGPIEFTLKLKNPARKAATIKEISGEIQAFLPAEDPVATVIAKDFLKQLGKPIADPALEKAGVKVTVFGKKEFEAFKTEEEQKAKNAPAEQKMEKALTDAFRGMFGGSTQLGENDLVVQYDESNGDLIDLQVQDAQGGIIQARSSMSSQGRRTLSFAEPLPADAQLKLLLKTEKSVVSVPFKVTDVALP